MALLLAIWLSVAPQSVIAVKGAAPRASDTSTPLPEQGSVAAGRYRNAYFGLSYPIPAGWSQQPAGPPPSDGGAYVLAQFALIDGEEHRVRANVLLSAQDLFFSAPPDGPPPQFVVERGPEEVTIAGRRFRRLDYGAPSAGLHWRMLSTEARCHALTFTFTGIDVAALDAAEGEMSRVALAPAGPPCVPDYADVAVKNEPVFPTHRFNPIPVRLIVGSDGRVKHVHILSAFPEQSQAILAALQTWRFKPYRRGGKVVPFETGMMFGVDRRRDAAGPAAGTAALH